MKVKRVKKIIALVLSVVLVASLSGCGAKTGDKAGTEGTVGVGNSESAGKITITNVSYDPTRELYSKYNVLFEKYYKDKYGKDVKVVQSHGGSGSQARSVIEGANADVVTLALEHDITLIQKAGLIKSGWRDEFKGNSSPYTSTIVFLVRKGNSKNIKDWDDLIKSGVNIITPDPKSSGGACWNFLAAWNFASVKFNNDEDKVKAFMKSLYANVSVMDSGARGATTTFVENGQGDVLIAWENEAIATLEEYPDKYEMISPSISILAQPSVAIVDENADKNGTQEVSKEYLQYLYSDEAQELIGKSGYRPSNDKILKEFTDKFNLNMKLCTIDDFGGWNAAYTKFFTDGGIFDEIHGN